MIISGILLFFLSGGRAQHRTAAAMGADLRPSHIYIRDCESRAVIGELRAGWRNTAYSQWRHLVEPEGLHDSHKDPIFQLNISSAVGLGNWCWKLRNTFAIS